MKIKSLKIKFIYFFFITFFFIFYFRLHDYGLPFIINADEVAGMKSLLYFYGFFTYANQNIVEPIYYPLINFLLTGFLILLKNIFVWNYSIENLKDFIYLNPHILFGFGRVASLIFCSLSLYIFYLISKKLNLNKYYILFSFIALATSYLFVDVSIVLGKNSLLLLLFLSQYYFFVKYFNKLEKFRLKSYIIFALLGSIAWGINYWGASPAIYAIIYLHFEKFGLKKINYILIFSVIFFLFGFLLNYYVTGLNIFSFFYDASNFQSFNLSDRFVSFYNDFLKGIKIIYNFEKSILFYLFFLILLSSLLIKLKKFKFIIFNLVLIFEPIFLFAIADGTYPVYPQLRYLGPSIFLIYLIIGYLIKNTSYKNYKVGIFLYVLVCSTFLFFTIEKISVLLNVKKIVNNKFIQFKIFEDYSLTNSIYFANYMIYRENIETLKIYSDLLDKKIIKLNADADGKNSIDEINKKIITVNRAKENNIFPSSKNFIFFGNEYLINEIDIFFEYIQSNFNYIIIEKKNEEFFNILNKKFKIHKQYETSDVMILRSLSNYLEKDFNKEKLKNIKYLGNTTVVFKIN